jgi:hypothetical protein
MRPEVVTGLLQTATSTSTAERFGESEGITTDEAHARCAKLPGTHSRQPRGVRLDGDAAHAHERHRVVHGMHERDRQRDRRTHLHRGARSARGRDQAPKGVRRN